MPSVRTFLTAALLSTFLLASSAAAQAESRWYITKAGYLVSTYRFILERAILLKPAKHSEDSPWYREWASEVFVIKSNVLCEITDEATWTGLVKIKAHPQDGNETPVVLWIQRDGLNYVGGKGKIKVASGRKG